MKDISVDRDYSLYLLSMSASNLCKTVTSKDSGVVESSKEKLEKGTGISLCTCKGDEMNKYSEKRTGSSATKITTTENSRIKMSSAPAEERCLGSDLYNILLRRRGRFGDQGLA
ncbi:hypothetical protein Fot_11198 [Forsythia ovata]|uniref:Uncharacterized protein n=1 Tax=Forsythia ovata TaxID=205694 RepID=A0ABD1WLR3_9LAMI